MSDYQFGDVEADDAYTAGALPDPDQVAYRLHELIAYLDDLAGTGGMSWSDLTPDEQRLGLEIGAVIVQWLIATDPDDPAKAAENLHNVRRYWSGGALPTWADLDADQRGMAIALMDAVISWLRREGTLPVGGGTV